MKELQTTDQYALNVIERVILFIHFMPEQSTLVQKINRKTNQDKQISKRR